MYTALASPMDLVNFPLPYCQIFHVIIHLVIFVLLHVMSTSSNFFDFYLFVSSLFLSVGLTVGGTELTALASIPVGLRVVRGRNWSRYDREEDGGAGNVGVIMEVKTNGFVSVTWSSGNSHSYYITSLATAPGETNREGRVKSKQNSLLPPLTLCIAF
jgi:hypothetical protein